MNIVIIGAGSIGVYLATHLSSLHYGIVLIDKDWSKLEKAQRSLDISVKHGSGTDWTILEELLELEPVLFISVTECDEVNLTSCSIAKHLGYPQTVARIRSNRFFEKTRLNFQKIFAVDHIIGPERLTANALSDMILIPNSLAFESFLHGTIHMRTVTIPKGWSKKKIPLIDKNKLELPQQVMLGLINRKIGSSLKKQVIFPHGSDYLDEGDQATFVGEPDGIEDLNRFLGLKVTHPKNVVIVGGSLSGFNLAKILISKNVDVRMIEQDYNKCVMLSKNLPGCSILHHSGTDVKFLQSNKIGLTDAFVACTRTDEVNLLAATLAKQLGCKNVIVSISDTEIIPYLNSLGISQVSSPRLYAGNAIVSLARRKTLASVVSLADHKADVMEIKVSTNAKVSGIPLKYLGPELPEELLVAFIQSQGRTFVADGSRIISPGDTVVVVGNPKHIETIKALF